MKCLKTLKNYRENTKFKLKYTKECVKYMIKCHEKAVIYFNFIESLEEIASFLNKINVSFVKLDERMSTNSIKTGISVFQENLLYKFALISYQVVPKIQSFNNISHAIFAEVLTNYS